MNPGVNGDDAVCKRNIGDGQWFAASLPDHSLDVSEPDRKWLSCVDHTNPANLYQTSHPNTVFHRTSLEQLKSSGIGVLCLGSSVEAPVVASEFRWRLYPQSGRSAVA